MGAQDAVADSVRCEECGKPFKSGGTRYSHWPRAKYCSSRCRSRAHSRRKEGYRPSPLLEENRRLRTLGHLLRDARDLLYHNSYCGIGNSEGCCGCALEAKIDAALADGFGA